MCYVLPVVFLISAFVQVAHKRPVSLTKDSASILIFGAVIVCKNMQYLSAAYSADCSSLNVKQQHFC